MNERRAIRTDLLNDAIKIMERLKKTRLLSRELLPVLEAMEPWASFRRGKPMSGDEMHALFKTAGARVRHVRSNKIVGTGYRLEDLVRARDWSLAHEGDETAVHCNLMEVTSRAANGLATTKTGRYPAKHHPQPEKLPQRVQAVIDREEARRLAKEASETGSLMNVLPGSSSTGDIETLPQLREKAFAVLSEVLGLDAGPAPDPDDKESIVGYTRIRSVQLDAVREVLKIEPAKRNTDAEEQGRKLWEKIEAKAKELAAQLAPGQEEWRRNHPECFPQVIDAESPES